jgi:DNA-directed RNA polymerase specialized sigma24 family protein
MGKRLGTAIAVARPIHGPYLDEQHCVEHTSELHPPRAATPNLARAFDIPEINLAAIDVRRILKSCKHNDRMVLQRHYLEGFKVQEIAEQQGWTETAVRIRLLRARRTVGKRLGRRYPEAPATHKRGAAAAEAISATTAAAA